MLVNAAEAPIETRIICTRAENYLVQLLIFIAHNINLQSCFDKTSSKNFLLRSLRVSDVIENLTGKASADQCQGEYQLEPSFHTVGF